MPIIGVGNMVPTGAEYFGPEQHDIDVKEIVSNRSDPLQILGRIHGIWDGELDTAVTLATKDLYTDREHHPDYLYVTNLLLPEVRDRLPIISSMAKVLGFEKLHNLQIQMQRPGCNMPKHKDPAEVFTDPTRVRLLVTLAPWEYGQYMFFNNTVFREWEVGTVIYTEFQNVWHSTANMSAHTRPILQITGTPSDKLKEMLLSSDVHTFNV
jgi:hypothetical protein